MKALLTVLLALSFHIAFAQEGTTEVKRLTPTEYKQHHQKDKKAVLVDVRTPEEFAAGHLKKAKNVDYRSGAFAEEMQQWDIDKTYYLYCATGNRSGKAAQLMKEAGFENVYNIGGFPELKEAGLPAKTPKKK